MRFAGSQVFAALALCAAMVGLSPRPAVAALRLCNQTSYVLYGAVGIQQTRAVATRGWIRIVPGDCATAVAGPLGAPAYFVYARTSEAHAGPSRAWGGQFRLCVEDAEFSLQTPLSAPACRLDDAFLVPFAPIDTGGAPDRTTTFGESAQIDSAAAARDAGLTRLLADNGYKVGTESKSRDAALADFRARMHLHANAGVGELFVALEARARKIAAPIGYSICNDGKSEIWAALGWTSGSDAVSRGWWSVPAGSCAKALSAALTGKIFLYATKPADHRLVAGATVFCTDDKIFEIRGRDRCSDRGLAGRGFAATNIAGAPGFTAHIGDDGLIEERVSPIQAPTPK